MPEDESALTYMAECYFHQDWDIEAPTPKGVVEAFVRNEEDETVSDLWDELNAIGAVGADEARAKAIWTGTGNRDLEPNLVGLTYEGWIAQLVEVVRAAVAAQGN